MNNLVRSQPVEPEYVAPRNDAMITLIERFVRDPEVDIHKLERLIEMRDAAVTRDAEQAFNADIAKAENEMEPVRSDCSNPQTRSKYASYAAIDRAVRPIYSKHGFALSFNTADGAADGSIRVLCYVSHRGGFTRQYHIDVPADGKGARGGDVMTKTHAVGSGISYGRRYLMNMIFNITVDHDDDGNAASARPQQNARQQDAVKWTAGFETAIENATDREELEKIVFINERTLEKLEREFPSLHASAFEIIKKRREEFAEDLKP